MVMKTHSEYWAAIDAYADGELPFGAAAELEGHLRTCDADCAQRVDRARREAPRLRTALTAPPPPPALAEAVFAQTTRRRTAARPALLPALMAGIAGNLITASVLVALSIGSGAPVGLMLGVAAVGAVLWGGVKGVAFAACLRYLPGNGIVRGVLFGIVLWAATNLALAAAGGFGTTARLSAEFLLLGSLGRSIVYGLLLGWLYELFAGTPRARSASV